MGITYFAIIYFIIMGAGLFLLYKKVLRPTADWYTKCLALENKIKAEDNKDEHIKEFYKLVKFSWHRSTGERLRELALMLEVKYNIELIKRD